MKVSTNFKLVVTDLIYSKRSQAYRNVCSLHIQSEAANTTNTVHKNLVWLFIGLSKNFQQMIKF